MAKKTITTKPSEKAKKVQPKKNVSGNAKKQPAKNKLITSMADVNAMTVEEFGKSINRIDPNLTDYEVEEYTRKHGNKDLHEAFIITDPKTGKKVFVGETIALAAGRSAEADPIGFALSWISYMRGNPHAN